MKYIEVTAGIIKNSENKYLIAQRKDGHLQGYWEFPGGKIDPGETPEECLKRELEEEFGIHVKVHDFVAESRFSYDNKNIALLGYNVEYVSGKFELREHSAIEWITSEEFDKFTFAPADIPIIDVLLER